MSFEKYFKEFKEIGALWVHDGNPTKPHALLTSGLHSDGYFNSRIVVANKNLLDSLAIDTISLIKAYFKELNKYISQSVCVVSPLGIGQETNPSLTFVRTFIKLLNYRYNSSRNKIDFNLVVVHKNNNGSFDIADIDSAMLKKSQFFVCDDVFSTGSTTRSICEVVMKTGSRPLTLSVVLFNRSGHEYFGKVKILSPVSHKMQVWPASKCPLCKVGSKAVRPKENWSLLNG